MADSRTEGPTRLGKRLRPGKDSEEKARRSAEPIFMFLYSAQSTARFETCPK
jgi:hypothetical protein